MHASRARIPAVRRRPLRTALAALLCAALVAPLALLPASAVAQDEPEPEQAEDPALRALVEDYMNDPVGARRELLRYQRGGAQLPPQMLVLLGDAYLRGGNYRAAERLFDEAGEMPVGAPWDGLATLGSGLSRAGRGDLAGAAPYLERAMDMPGGAGEFAALAAGQVAAADGRYDDAYAAFDRVQTSDDARNELLEAAAFARAATAYAAGDTERAAAGFEALAANDPDAAIASDARYGAALALLAEGDREQATALLRGLAKDCRARSRSGGGVAGVSALEPRAVLRRWLRNYREVGFDLQPKGERAVPLASLDGCRLARVKLRELTRGDAAPVAPAVRSAALPRAAPEPAAAPAAAPVPPPPSATAADEPAGGLAPWVVGALLVAAAALALWWRGRRGAPGA